MNEFTKDELETLAACVSTYAKDEPDDYIPLLDKICELIDNYCSHADSKSDHNYEVQRCKKCGELFI